MGQTNPFREPRQTQQTQTNPDKPRQTQTNPDKPRQTQTNPDNPIQTTDNPIVVPPPPLPNPSPNPSILRQTLRFLRQPFHSSPADHLTLSYPYHTMDEASKLVVELQRKLTELDHKVALYRKDMNDEFIKYEEDLLKNVPKDISHRVTTIIADSLKSYKALYPDASNVDSCAASINHTTVTSSSPGTLTIPHANRPSTPMTESQQGSSTSVIALPFYKRDEDMDRPRSPHEREKEFTGLFTPSYLPLLDSSNRYDRQPADMDMDMEDKPKDKQFEALQVDASTDTRSLAASPDLRKPPAPLRKNTDEISIASDVSSDGPIRRSALRRSSSYNKGSSPRRVRFDVEGQEVLPTVSPQDTALDSSIPLSAFGDDSDDEAGAEQVEDIDAPPPPKRISSSQALRALSRGPFEDDGVQWTTVSAPPDGSASIATSTNGTLTKENDLEITPITSPSPREEENVRPIPIPAKTSEPDLSPPRMQHVEIPQKEEPEIDVLSEDDMLDMPPRRQMRNQPLKSASILSPIRTEHEEFTSSSPLMMRSPSKPLTLEPLEPRGEGDEKLTFNDDDEHDDLFHFDEAIDRGSPPEDQEDSDTEEAASLPGLEEDTLDKLNLARSPPRPVGGTRFTSSASTPSKGIVGSYKGHPFGMPVVSDEVHAKAASLGNMNSFVGSVNGRSGLDESDILSFRASGGVGSFSGTPRSLSERMMMEDLMEAEGEGR
ncbi:hypothetical protein ACMFMG_005088 [Clarireedia jacksonii]